MNVNNNVQGLQQLFPAQGGARTENTAAQQSGSAAVSGSADQTTLSPAASMAAASAQDSGVRMEKVASIQQAIAAGTYNIPASAVAGKMMDHMMGK
jgi:negative regulator of flagellin synthesis FlgM